MSYYIFLYSYHQINDTSSFHCLLHMRSVMRKPAFYLCEKKGTDQLCSNCTADQCLCFRYTDSTFPLLLKYEISKPLSIFCECTDWFVSDLVGNPEDRFTRKMAHIFVLKCSCRKKSYCSMRCITRKHVFRVSNLVRRL